ncbi:MAG: hypothetical protein ACLP1Y_07665 [Candidatus Acidiferrales bacterium]
MAQSLGSLYVELSANTAQFTGALSKAAVTARTAAKEISTEFSSLARVASQTFGAFGTFNPIVSQLSFALSQVGRAASSAMGEFGKIRGTIGSVAALTAGAAAGALAFGGAVLAMGLKGIESAAAMEDLAEKSGVTVEEMSGLSFAARQVGISQDDLSLALARLSKNAAMASEGSRMQALAFKALHVNATDASGALRPIGDILLDIAARFAAAKDSTAKTAIAMEAFGRAGYQMIPLLNQGKEGIQAFINTAQDLGLVISTETARSAVQLQQQMGALQGRFQAFENQVAAQMIPTLTALMKQLNATGQAARGLEGAVPSRGFWSEALQKTIVGVATVAEAVSWLAWRIQQLGETIAVVFTLGLWQKPIDAIKAQETEIDKEAAALKRLSAAFEEANDLQARQPQMVADFMKFAGPKPAPGLQEFLAGRTGAELQDISRRAMAAHESPAALATQLMKAQGGMLSSPGGAGTYATGAVANRDVIAQLITKLQAETAAQLGLANATSLSVAAMAMQKAAGEADTRIAETRTELLDRERSLQEQLANAKANQQAPEAARIESEIAGVKKLVSELSTDTPLIRNLYVELAAAQEATREGGEMSKEGLGFARQISSLEGLVAAYKEGGAAIAGADVEGKLEEDKQRVSELMELLADVAATDPFNFPALADLLAWLGNANAMLSEHREQLMRIQALDIDKEIAKQTAAFREEAGAIAGVTAARLQSLAAQRAAAVGEEVAKHHTENRGESPGQLAQFAALAKARSDQAWATSTSEVAAEYQVQGAYQRTREKMEAARAALVAAGESTLAIDDEIYSEELRHREDLAKIAFDTQNSELIGLAKVYDMRRQQIEQFDEMANKVGTLGERFRALANDIELAGENLTGKLFDSVSKMVDDVSGQLAKLVMTGQSSFKKMFEGLAEQTLKSGFQSAFAGILKLAVGGPKTAGGRGGGAEGAAGGIAGTIGKIFGIKMPGAAGGARGDSPTNPLYVAMANASGALGSLPLTAPSTIRTLLTGGSSSDGGGDGGGGLDSIFKSIGGGLGSFGSMLGTAATSIGSGIMKVFSMFGGFLAEGGEVTPGKAYMVGEKHPEFFLPKQAGTVVPALASGGTMMQHNEVHLHFPGVTDPDSFRRSQGQIHAQMHAQLAAAHSRRG